MKRLKWTWQYHSVDSDNPVAKGRLWTNAKPTDDGYYRVKTIKGHRDGAQIDSLLPAGTSIPGNIDTITGQPYLGDNRIKPEDPNSDRPQLTSGGIIFSLKDGSFSNLFYGNYPPTPSYYDFHSVAPFPNGVVSPNSQSFISFTAEIVS
jgi:hypothetical protein